MRGANAKQCDKPAAGEMHHNRSTYLGGDGIFIDGDSLLVLSLLPLSLCGVGLVDASEASVDSAGSWIEALLPCRCSGWCVNDATVELDEDGLDMSRPTSSGLIDGSFL